MPPVGVHCNVDSTVFDPNVAAKFAKTIKRKEGQKM